MAGTSLPIRFLLAVIRRAAMNAIRIPPAVIDSGIQSLPSRVHPKGTSHALSGRRKFSTTAMQRLLASKDGLAAELERHSPNFSMTGVSRGLRCK